MIHKIIAEIADVGSTLAKEAILHENASNKTLKQVFNLTENPRIQFYIKSKELPDTSGKGEITEVVLDKLIPIVNRLVTGNAARDLVIEIMKPLSHDEQVIIQRIVNKDLRCNCGTSIVNKVWKGMIPEYPMMLASKGDVKSMQHLEKVGGPYIVQKKCDGGRVNAIVSLDNKVTYRSRNGNELTLHGAFDAIFSRFPGAVFDGEILARNEDGVMDRKTGNGLYTKAVRGTLSEKEAASLCIEVWDLVSGEEVAAGVGIHGYAHRLELLRACMLVDKENKVIVVESEQVNTLEECNDFYKRMRSQGEEGAIIKVASGVWEDKRSKNMVKMKANESADLECFDIEPGKGKHEGLIGALWCRTKCKKLVVKVGTGFKDADRALPREHYVGKIIEVNYNEVITSKGKDTASLFLPVYNQIRYDKNVSNTMDELK